MSRTVGVADINGDRIDLAIFSIQGKQVTFITEEQLHPGETSRFPGLEVWLMVHSRDRSIRYVTLPKSAQRQAREIAFLQATPTLPLDQSEYAHDALVKPVGDGLGALVIAIPLEKAHAWENRLSDAGIVLVSFAVAPLFYPLLRSPVEGNSVFAMPTPRGNLALVGCHNGTPVCWKSIKDQSEIPAGGLDGFLVQEYFCEAPQAFKAGKVLAGEKSIEPRLVAFLAAAHLAAMTPRPWDKRALLTFSEFLQREQQAPAAFDLVVRCAAIWLVVAALLFGAAVALVNTTERKERRLRQDVEDTKAFATQSVRAAQEVSVLMEAHQQLRSRTLDKTMALEIMRKLQDMLPDRVKLANLRYDVQTGLRIECLAEQEADILRLLDKARSTAGIRELKLVFAEARDDGLFHFLIECKLPGNTES